MKIKEYQYEKDNVLNFQERIIEVKDFYKYVQDFIEEKYQENGLCSLPVNSKIEPDLTLGIDQVEFSFWHGNMNTMMKHVATVIEEE